MKEAMRIGFVATRLAGTDGVSLEAGKWLKVLNRIGAECFCFCSHTDWPAERAMLVEQADFLHEDIRGINHELFAKQRRSDDLSRRVQKIKDRLKQDLREFVDTFDIEVLIAENALSLPMNIPLGLALTEFVAESQIPTLAHHHDFWWERDRYAGGPAEDYLQAAFPAMVSPIRHVVINSVAERELAFRTGVKSTLIPNVMDFANEPDPPDDYTGRMRADIGIENGAAFILQPTRIVPRKRIEKAVELIRRVETDCALVVTHDAGDEGHAYVDYLKQLAEIMQVRLLMPSQQFNAHRGQTSDGRTIYSLKDAYQCADLISYCSAVEGFGNAFLETIYHKRPLFMSAYEIFSLDIQPKGFRLLAFSDFIDDDMVASVDRLLADPAMAAEWAEHNYRTACRYYSLETLECKLTHALDDCVGRC